MKSLKVMKGFGLRPKGEVARRIGCTATSANMAKYDALSSATAFFMSFMLFMVEHILGAGRRLVCVLSVFCGKNSLRKPKVQPDIYATLGGYRVWFLFLNAAY